MTLMSEQQRKFTLGEVHTKIGTEGQILFDQEFMEILGVKPGDWIGFFIDKEGVVTVKGEKKAPIAKPAATIRLSSTDVTQQTLFDTGLPIQLQRPKRRR